MHISVLGLQQIPSRVLAELGFNQDGILSQSQDPIQMAESLSSSLSPQI